jgi:hypothetical protein
MLTCGLERSNCAFAMRENPQFKFKDIFNFFSF